MKSRRKAREAALQALYQCDSLDSWDLPTVELYFQNFQSELELEDFVVKENMAFARGLVCGVIEQGEFVDRQISAASTHWSINRMSRVDRNILRFATYEIAFMNNVPVNVSINEAIEVAKRFGTADSPMFVNGVLDKLATTLRAEGKIEAGEKKAVANG